MCVTAIPTRVVARDKRRVASLDDDGVQTDWLSSKQIFGGHKREQVECCLPPRQSYLSRSLVH